MSVISILLIIYLVETIVCVPTMWFCIYKKERNECTYKRDSIIEASKLSCMGFIPAFSILGAGMVLYFVMQEMIIEWAKNDPEKIRQSDIDKLVEDGMEASKAEQEVAEKLEQKPIEPIDSRSEILDL